MITNAIHNANDSHEVLLLLTTYIEGARATGRVRFLAEGIAPASLNHVSAVREHLENLLLELDAASRNLDDHTRDVLHEAVHVFGIGLDKIVKLERHQHARIAA
jgi:predicted Zn-dependent protease with MMP-like domain